MDAFMKIKALTLAFILTLTTGCANYNARSTGEGQDTSTVGRIACDAEPANQPGCYVKQSKEWNWGGLQFGLGAKK
ncbi:hypothetical protein D3C80_1758130 [compost metagenome]